MAVDQETIDAGAHTGRRFRGRWSFVRADAYREVLRLREQLSLPATTVAAIDEVLHAVLATPEPDYQDRWNVPLRFLVDRVDIALRERSGAQSVAVVTRERPLPVERLVAQIEGGRRVSLLVI